jgi:hypothetical protein
MFTLVLHFPVIGKLPRSQQQVTSGHVQQIGSMISASHAWVHTWKVVSIGQDVVDGVMSSTLHVYLDEVDD